MGLEVEPERSGYAEGPRRSECGIGLNAAPAAFGARCRTWASALTQNARLEAL